MALTQVSTDGIKNSTIVTADLADDAVTGAKIASQTITGANILDLAISAAELNNDAVTTQKLADGAVNNARIADDTITNLKINSSAAIAGTKISPNFGSQNILTTGDVGIGTTSPSNLLHCSRTSTTAYSSSLTTNDSTVLLQNLGAAGHSTLEFQCKSSGTTQTGKATISAFTEAASSRATS